MVKTFITLPIPDLSLALGINRLSPGTKAMSQSRVDSSVMTEKASTTGSLSCNIFKKLYRSVLVRT